jgi:hypothetical protein
MAAQLTEVKAEEGSDIGCVHDTCQRGIVRKRYAKSVSNNNEIF